MIKELAGLPILCSDVIFKSIFIKNPNILRMFVCDMTGIDIKNMELVVNEIPIVRNNEKFKRCDFLIRYDNIIINIELNSSYSKTLLVKNTSYIFSLFSQYTSRGEEYFKDLEVIQININLFSRFSKPILDFRILDYVYSYNYFNALKILDLDIVKCKNMYYNERVRKKNYLKWGALFAAHTVEDIQFILEELVPRKEVDKMVEDLYNLTAPGKTISEAEALRLDDMFRRSLRQEGVEEGMKQGIEQGIEQGKLDIIKALFKRKMSYHDISDISGKSIEEIKEIEKMIN